MSRYEWIKMFEITLRMLFLIYWKVAGDKYKDESELSILHRQLFDEYNEFMNTVEFRRK